MFMIIWVNGYWSLNCMIVFDNMMYECDDDNVCFLIIYGDL